MGGAPSKSKRARVQMRIASLTEMIKDCSGALATGRITVRKLEASNLGDERIQDALLQVHQLVLDTEIRMADFMFERAALKLKYDSILL
jgi:hypothetical protein